MNIESYTISAFKNQELSGVGMHLPLTETEVAEIVKSVGIERLVTLEPKYNTIHKTLHLGIKLESSNAIMMVYKLSMNNKTNYACILLHETEPKFELIGEIDGGMNKIRTFSVPKILKFLDRYEKVVTELLKCSLEFNAREENIRTELKKLGFIRCKNRKNKTPNRVEFQKFNDFSIDTVTIRGKFDFDTLTMKYIKSETKTILDISNNKDFITLVESGVTSLKTMCEKVPKLTEYVAYPLRDFFDNTLTLDVTLKDSGRRIVINEGVIDEVKKGKLTYFNLYSDLNDLTTGDKFQLRESIIAALDK